MQLTDKTIRAAKPSDKALKLTDGAGLYLEVTPSGSKLWRYRFRLEGKESVFAIGAYPQISLADARKLRDDARDLVKQGINPAQARQQAKQATIDESKNTFALSADAWYTEKRPTWGAHHAHTVRRILDADVLPRIGSAPIRSLTTPDFYRVMKRIQARGAATRAILARQIMVSVIDYAVLQSRADENKALPLRREIARRVVEHRRHLEEQHVGEFIRKLRDYSGHPTTRLAVQLQILTAVRPGEILGAAWAEFDLDAARWDIPKDRMKMRRPHVVPLSKQAVACLRELEEVTGDGAYLFPSQGTKTRTQPVQTLGRAIARMGFSDRCSPHGLRGTFSTMLNERGYNPDWIETQLAHVKGDAVRASYNHAQYLNDRRNMMQAWADLLDELADGAKVIQLRRTA